jgi:hypothetical protein
MSEEFIAGNKNRKNCETNINQQNLYELMHEQGS